MAIESLLFFKTKTNTAANVKNAANAMIKAIVELKMLNWPIQQLGFHWQKIHKHKLQNSENVMLIA